MGLESVVCDERGRIVLAKELRDEYGERFMVVRATGEVVLVPIPADPLKDLQEIGKKIPRHLSVKDLKRMARQRALREVLGEPRRRPHRKPRKKRR